MWKSTVYRKYRVSEDFSHCVEWTDKEKDKKAVELRDAKRLIQNVLELSFFPKPEQMPIIFEDVYVSSKAEIPEYQ